MPTNTIRLSLSTIVLIIGGVFFIALMGGALGSRIFAQPLPLRSDTNGTIIPVSQEVVVSPSKLASDIVQNHGKSVFLLGLKTSTGINALGTGIALTNDGILMATEDLSQENIVGVGEDGIIFPLAPVGRDELSGISFYKASDRIITPFNLSQSAPRIGSSLLALHRISNITDIFAHTTTLASTSVPTESFAPGIQKIALIDSAAALPSGAALVDENGNLAGVFIDPEDATALFTSDIRAALERLSSNRLAYNPFQALGFSISWISRLDDNDTMRIASNIRSVLSNSPADIAGLKTGDILTAIDGNTVSWDTNVATILNAKTLNLTVMRQGQQRTIPLTP